MQVQPGISTRCQKISSWLTLVSGHQLTGALLSNSTLSAHEPPPLLRTGPNWINYVQFFFPNLTLLKEVIHKMGSGDVVHDVSEQMSSLRVKKKFRSQWCPLPLPALQCQLRSAKMALPGFSQASRRYRWVCSRLSAKR